MKQIIKIYLQEIEDDAVLLAYVKTYGSEVLKFGKPIKTVVLQRKTEQAALRYYRQIDIGGGSTENYVPAGATLNAKTIEFYDDEGELIKYLCEFNLSIGEKHGRKRDELLEGCV